MTAVSNAVAQHTPVIIKPFHRLDVLSHFLFPDIFTQPQLERSFEGEIVHLGPEFKEGMPLNLDDAPALLTEGILKSVRSQINRTNSKFTFWENGFEFASFKGTPFGTALANLAKDPLNEETPCWENRSFARALEGQMAEWGRNTGIEFSEVIWVDTVYRDTMQGKFKAVHFAHVDFPDAKSHRATLQGHADWRNRVVERLGDMSPAIYEKLNVSKIVNLWMPLDQKLEAEPLAMMDLQSLDRQEQPLQIYKDQRKSDGGSYLSVGVKPHEGQKWYTRSQMGLGDGIIFDCCKTPHSAVSLPNQGNKKRTSAECRVLFISLKSNL